MTICRSFFRLFFNLKNIEPKKYLQKKYLVTEDQNFYRIQWIAWYHHKKMIEIQELVEKFVNLYSNHLTFIDNWNNDRIHPSMMRPFSKRVFAKDAAKNCRYSEAFQ